MSLSLLLLKCHVHAASKQFQTTAYNSVHDNSLRCFDGFMTVFVSKVQFAELPLTVYVADEDSGYYQATAIAKQCHYFLHESVTFITFTVASHSCFVKRQKNFTSLNVVIMAPANRGRLEIVKSFLLVCERRIKEATTQHYPPVPRQLFCNKDGFNITVSQNATLPPLNPDSVWIPSYQSHNCRPQTRSKDAVTFLFPFTDCGTQSVVADGIITYWVTIETKQMHQQNVSIFRDTPFHLTVQCSFALAQMTQLHIEVQGETFEYPSALGSSGILRAEMSRFLL
ncbi:uncharacterized protein LOC131463062 [Solea solea]|uniref:uncharacterized protein LOC131463062 n=1 Tax=Solea solea TaxID=90069 RepID=UPI00272D06E0|nr:uncharacterized protein LOC131463062 [Solea solea]